MNQQRKVTATYIQKDGPSLNQTLREETDLSGYNLIRTDEGRKDTLVYRHKEGALVASVTVCDEFLLIEAENMEKIRLAEADILNYCIIKEIVLKQRH